MHIRHSPPPKRRDKVHLNTQRGAPENDPPKVWNLGALVVLKETILRVGLISAHLRFVLTEHGVNAAVLRV